ncbi:hypothetical protein IFO72_07560 [Streptococcus macedonicus]|uniref:hypothetical protein n=1 Tax=Streptococcus macedonicus TaxID=59310 RepID=UPI00189B670F|nr:hypothetical protein [Streptococcus macedonicus]MBF6977129.1 hypothetical protein [Streptococcus macedonicus]
MINQHSKNKNTAHEVNLIKVPLLFFASVGKMAAPSVKFTWQPLSILKLNAILSTAKEKKRLNY